MVIRDTFFPHSLYIAMLASSVLSMVAFYIPINC